MLLLLQESECLDTWQGTLGLPSTRSQSHYYFYRPPHCVLAHKAVHVFCKIATTNVPPFILPLHCFSCVTGDASGKIDGRLKGLDDKVRNNGLMRGGIGVFFPLAYSCFPKFHFLVSLLVDQGLGRRIEEISRPNQAVFGRHAGQS